MIHEPKVILFNQDAFCKIENALEKLVRLIAPTLGPFTETVISSTKDEGVRILSSTYEILQEINLEDRFEDSVVELVKEAVRRMKSTVGDMTATMIILTRAIFKEGMKYVRGGYNSSMIEREIKKAAQESAKRLDDLSFSIQDSKQIKSLATIAAGHDEKTGELFSRIVDRIGRGSAVLVEESQGTETTVDIIEGFQFTGGFISRHFINNPQNEEVILDNPYLLLYEGKISSVSEIISLLEKVMQSKRALLILSGDIESEVIAALLVNRMKGELRSCAAKLPGSEKIRRELLEDLSCIIGGRFFLGSSGIGLKDVKLADLGRARKVIVDKDKTTVISGAGSRQEHAKRVSCLKEQLRNPDFSLTEKEEIQDRLLRLSGNIVQLRPGGYSTHEISFKKVMLQSSINAIRVAIEGGALAGAGVSLIKATRGLDQNIGASIIKHAIIYPARQILQNAGCEPEIILDKIQASKEPGFGFNVVSGRYCSLIKEGVIDAKSAVRMALETATSLACIFLSTDAMIARAKGFRGNYIPPGIEQAEAIKNQLPF